MVDPSRTARTDRRARVRDERASTPLVGALLVVAITAILASVVGVYSVGLITGIDEAVPNVDFDVEYDESAAELTVRHVNGDAVEASQLSWTVRGGDESVSASGFTGEVSSGSEATVTGVDADETVILVWSDAEHDRSGSLLEWDGPEV